MPKTLFVALLLGIGCAAENAEEKTAEPSQEEMTETETTDTETEATDTETETELPEGLSGTVPDSSLPAPEFQATSNDGSSRGPEDLIGQPTVVWFFPLAGTYG